MTVQDYEQRATSMAISCMWAWMIPHFYIEFMEYRLALEKVSLSRAWNHPNGKQKRKDGKHEHEHRHEHEHDVCEHDNDNDNKNESSPAPQGSSARETANAATVDGALWAMGIIGVVYLGSALLVGALTKEPDPQVLTKSGAIAIGVGRMLSSCLFMYLSVEMPKWLGVSYSSHKYVESYKETLLEPSENSNKELSFRVCWSLLGHFFVMYPFLLAYFCKESFAHVALSTGVGVACGLGLVYFVWLGHTELNCKNRTRIAIVLSLLITVASAAAFAAGCWYVKEVWYDVQKYTYEYTAVTCFVWLVMCLLAHGVHYRLTKRKLAEAKALRAHKEHDTVAGDASEAASTKNPLEEVESMKGEWRYNSQVFQPPKSIQIHCVAVPFMKRGRKHGIIDKDKDKDTIKDDTKKTGNAKIKTDTLPQSPVQQHEMIDEEIMPEPHLVGIVEGEVLDHLSSKPRGTKYLQATPTKKRVRINTRDTFSTDGDGTIESEKFECCSSAKADPLSPPSLDPINNSMDEEDEDSLFEGSIEERELPTLWYLMKANSCCGRRRYYQAKRRKGWSRFVVISKWTLYTLAVAWHLGFAVVNIGASHQQNKVRGVLDGTYEKLYPPNYNTGAMCAWDEASPGADIRTFNSLQDVEDAEYTVIHCGECGHCSNWNDLSLQWTTRGHLAQTAKDCVTKSFLGSREVVQECNEQSIGFTEECSMCWTVDEYCARDNCMFIFLQSVFTNQVNNFNVGPVDITSATCDEALCGPEFVPCSGATRRRMNIVSDIPRPVSQRCRVANEDWSLVFDHP